MKTIKIREETWKKLMRLKIDHNKTSIDETINMLLESRKGEK